MKCPNCNQETKKLTRTQQMVHNVHIVEGKVIVDTEHSYSEFISCPLCNFKIGNSKSKVQAIVEAET